ncbi:MAG: GNAT family N-acetyltransferase [Proteobacteria bacterium]|nr:GNAT family N-acetyltransferase [Pseudomonadota bacterium]
MIVVNYHDDLNEVQGDPVLVALLSAPHARTPFDRTEWWRNLADNCKLQPLVAVAGDGVERAVLPLMRDGQRLSGLANWYTFRLAPLATPGADRPALFAALARNLARKTRRVTLDKLGDEDAALIANAFRDAGWTVWQEQCDVNHCLEVGGRSFAQYLSARPGSLRTTLKRKAAKLDLTLYDSFDADAWAAYEAVYAASWKPQEGSPAFLRRFAAEEGAAGRLRMAVGHIDGQPVAAQFWTVEHGTAFIHKLAHRDDARQFSPGTVLSAALFEQVIDRDKVDWIDFGTGDDAYKRDWMELVRPRFRLDMIRPRHPKNWPLIARHALRSLRGQR